MLETGISGGQLFNWRQETKVLTLFSRRNLRKCLGKATDHIKGQLRFCTRRGFRGSWELGIRDDI